MSTSKSNKVTKQVFIEMPNLNKKIKKIYSHLIDEQEYNYIIHQYGKYVIKTNDIFDVTNIPIECYKREIKFQDDVLTLFINKFKNINNTVVNHIPQTHQLIRTKKSIYTLNDKANVSFVIEKHIPFDYTTNDYELDFTDKDNNIITEYYFIFDDVSEDSYFVKEDIFSFFKHLN